MPAKPAARPKPRTPRPTPISFEALTVKSLSAACANAETAIKANVKTAKKMYFNLFILVSYFLFNLQRLSNKTFFKNSRGIISPHFRYALDFYSAESRLLSRAGIVAYIMQAFKIVSILVFKKLF